MIFPPETLGTVQKLAAFYPCQNSNAGESIFTAGKAFVNYRRNDGKKTTILPDFFIGAHASVMGWNIITRDSKRMSYYFPKLKIISPE